MYPHALMRGKPPSTTLNRLLRNQLSLASLLAISIYILTFCGQAGQQNKGKGAQIPLVCSAPRPVHPCNITPLPHLQLIPHQGKHHARVTPFRITVRFWSNVSFAFFAKFTHLVLNFLFSRRDRDWGGIWEQGRRSNDPKDRSAPQ